MTDTLEDHVGTVSLGGRTDLRFADDINGLGRAGRTTSESGPAWTSQRHKGWQTTGRDRR